MNAILTQAQTMWTALGFNQKLMLGTLVVATVLAGLFFMNRVQEDYDILYSNLSLPDASAAVAKLRDLKAPYRLGDNGTTILVPHQQKNDLVLQTASELSSDQTVTLSEIPPIVQGDVQKEWIKKYNTDSIAQILKGVKGIKNAQVIVSQPEKSLFSDQEDVITASVMLVVEPGFHLKADQARTIKNLVAHAVPGLKLENVVLADNTGNPIDDMKENEGGDADFKRKHLEEEITRKIVTVLSPVVGRENLVVSVSAKMNFDQSQAHVHRVIPMGGADDAPTGVTLSQQEQVEEYAKAGAAGTSPGGGGGSGSGGIPGTQSNIPTYQATTATNTKGAGGAGNPALAPGNASTQGSGNGNNYKLTKRTVNYANSEEDRQTTYATGTIERVSVSVVLNKVLTSQEIDELQDVVSNAAGIDQSRGDSVDVKGFQFSQPLADKEKELAEKAKSVDQQAFILQLVTALGGVILGGIALFLLYKLLPKPVAGELLDDDDDDDDDNLMLPPMGMQYLQGMQEEAGVTQPLFENLDPDLEMKRNTITSFIDQEPTEAARFLMSYLKDVD